MITKAKILQLPKGAYQNEQGELVVDNKFKIYIPIFRRAGEPIDNPLSASTMYATLCYNPGAENGYRVGDVVYISFENNQMGEPIILGKLFLNNSQESLNTTYLVGDELNISNTAKLPINTTIGDRSGEDIDALFRRVDNTENRISNLNDDLTTSNVILDSKIEDVCENLSSDISELKEDVDNLSKKHIYKLDMTASYMSNRCSASFIFASNVDVNGGTYTYPQLLGSFGRIEINGSGMVTNYSDFVSSYMKFNLRTGYVEYITTSGSSLSIPLYAGTYVIIKLL